MERIHDIKLTRVGLPGEHHVPDEEPAAGPKHAVDFLEDLGVVGRREGLRASPIGRAERPLFGGDRISNRAEKKP